MCNDNLPQYGVRFVRVLTFIHRIDSGKLATAIYPITGAFLRYDAACLSLVKLHTIEFFSSMLRSDSGKIVRHIFHTRYCLAAKVSKGCCDMTVHALRALKVAEMRW